MIVGVLLREMEMARVRIIEEGAPELSENRLF